MHYAKEESHEQHHRHCGGRHHHSHHRHHHEHDFAEDEALYSYYGELEQKAGLKLLVDILAKLQANGMVMLSGHQVSITNDIGFSISHEETWDDTEKLTLEIEWTPEQDENGVAEEAVDDDSSTPPVIS